MVVYWNLLGLKNVVFQFFLRLSERQKEEIFKYLINDFVKVFEFWYEEFESISYFLFIEDVIKMVIYDLDYR